MATKSLTDAKALRSISRRCCPWNASAQRKGGIPARASFTPSRAPRKIATIGCKINLNRPGPDNRANASSKKRPVNKYKSPVCMSRRTVLGSTPRIIKTMVARRIELRDSTIFILVTAKAKCCRGLRLRDRGREATGLVTFSVEGLNANHTSLEWPSLMSWTPASLANIPGSSKLN